MRSFKKTLLLFVVIFLIMRGNRNQLEGTEFITSSSISIDQDGTSIRIDNATLTSGFLGIALKVQYTRFEVTPFEVPAMSVYGPLYIGLLLSLDNISWNTVIKEIYSNNDIWMNGSSEFVVENSLITPFPFDVERDDTLFICVERGLEGYRVNRTPTVALQSPFDIIRLWYFTIDWKIPLILSAIPLSLFVVFLVSRRRRKTNIQERRLKTSICDQSMR